VHSVFFGPPAIFVPGSANAAAGKGSGDAGTVGTLDAWNMAQKTGRVAPAGN
jgi:hypothetical protein